MSRIIKVATFNVFNLVLPETKYYETRQYSRDDYERKLDWIAYQLKQMNADIVGFQEVFHHEALLAAVERSNLYTNCRVITADPTGKAPGVGIVSKFPISDHEIIHNFPDESIIDIENEASKERIVLPFTKFSRPVLRAKIQISDTLDFQVYVIHLKSKRPLLLDGEDRNNELHLAKAKARSLMLRASEAAALRSVLLQQLLNKKEVVIAMGDVNDNGLAVTSQIISAEPPQRRLPQEVKSRIWDTVLYHVKDIQARRSYGDFYYTYIHNGHHESLDHIMVSQEIVAENPNNIGRVGYVSTFNDHLIDETLTNEKIPSWKSDHGQVVATIELR